MKKLLNKNVVGCALCSCI